MDKLQPRAIIFDLGSTLIEYETKTWDELGLECAESGRRFLVDKGLELPDREGFEQAFSDVRKGYREVAAGTLKEWSVPMVAEQLFENLGIKPEEGLVDEFFNAYYEPVGAQLFAFKDTIPTLADLRPSAQVIGLVSNTVFPERVHREELRRFGIAPYLDFAVFSSSFGLRKPHADIFYHAANLAGVAPSEAVYIGDRYVEDVKGPNSIGMNAVLKVHPKREYPDEMPEATRRITALSELTEHIKV